MGSVGTVLTGSRYRGISVAIAIVRHSLQSRGKESKRKQVETRCQLRLTSPRIAEHFTGLPEEGMAPSWPLLSLDYLIQCATLPIKTAVPVFD